MFTSIWDLKRRILRAEEKLQQAREKNGKLESEVSELRKKVDRLSFVSQSMWELLSKQSDLSEEDLENKIKEVHGRDEEIDWEISGQVAVCKHCGSHTDTRRKICLMCGEPLE